MTMHLLPAFVTTTRSNKRQPQRTKTRATIEHEQWIRKMTGGQRSDSAAQSSHWRREYAESLQVDREYVSNNSVGNGTKPEPKVYTGTNLMGIATMHKSNMVPVFKDNKEAAADIAKMRR